MGLGAASAHGALYINQARNDAGNGPVDSFNVETTLASNYLAYTENGGSTGDLQTFAGVTFGEGNLSGSYNVGVAYSWSNIANRRDVYRSGADGVYSTSGNQFHETFLGAFVASGETMTLSLSGLPVSQAFVLTTYHFDTDSATGATFTTNLTGSTTFTSGGHGGAAGTFVDPTPYVYEFDVVSDASGEADVVFSINSNNMFAINGFDLEAVPVPEPTSALLLSLGGVALLARRKK